MPKSPNFLTQEYYQIKSSISLEQVVQNMAIVHIRYRYVDNTTQVQGGSSFVAC